MSKASKPVKRRGYSKLDPIMDDKLKRLDEAKRIVDKADRRLQAAIARANKRHKEEVGTAPQDVESLNEELATFLERYHPSLTRRLSRTIQRAFGTIFVVLRTKELDLPADVKPVAAMLEDDDEGRQFLKPYVPQLDKTALKAAITKGEVSTRLMAKLHGLGVWYGKHLTFLVKTSTDDSAVTISRRPYRQRRRAS